MSNYNVKFDKSHQSVTQRARTWASGDNHSINYNCDSPASNSIEDCPSVFYPSRIP
jgi:hypothetical protein